MIIKTVNNFLTEEECENVITLIEKNNCKSSVIDQESKNPYATTLHSSRTSSSSFFDINDELIISLSKRVSKYLEVETGQLEPLQGQKYEQGQYFKPHYDYIHTTQDRMNVKKCGNRIWTCLIYLNDDFEGGETNFPKINLQIKPKKGMALMFENVTTDNTLETNSLHEGKEITKGIKYIITAWIRERHYTFN